jgi:hypothetical protein
MRPRPIKNRRPLWRWRRNPLKRSCDRAEAWVRLTAALIMAVTAPVTGAVAADSAAAGLRDRPGVYRAQAVLREDAPKDDELTTVSSDEAKVLALVEWKAPDGRVRTGRAFVETGQREGARVRVWLDGHGVPHRPPPDRTEVLIESGLAGGAAAAGACVAAGTGCWLVRRRLDAARERAWEREWSQVGPWWSKRG